MRTCVETVIGRDLRLTGRVAGREHGVRQTQRLETSRSCRFLNASVTTEAVDTPLLQPYDL
jgi:hypothetical protein